jgi:hypothetical protein
MRRTKGLRSTPAVAYTQKTNASSANSQSSEQQQQQQHSVSDSTAVSESKTTAAVAAADSSKDIMQHAVDPALEQWRLQQNGDNSP